MSLIRVGALAGALLSFATLAAAAPPLEDYGKLPQVRDIELSPRGDNVAILASVGDEGRLIVRSLAGGPPLLAINTGGVKVHDVTWMGPNHVAIRVSETLNNNPYLNPGTNEVFQTTVYNTTTKKAVIIFRANSKKIFPLTLNYYGYSASNGHENGYFDGEPLRATGSQMADFEKTQGDVPDEDSARLDLYRVDLDTEEATTVSGGSPRTDNFWVVAPDGSVAAESSYRQDTADWRLYAHSTGGLMLDEVTSATHDIGLNGLGRTPNSVLVVRPGSDGDWSYREYIVNAAGGGVELF